MGAGSSPSILRDGYGRFTTNGKGRLDAAASVYAAYSVSVILSSQEWLVFKVSTGGDEMEVNITALDGQTFLWAFPIVGAMNAKK